jgi:YD repeat-containing protein
MGIQSFPIVTPSPVQTNPVQGTPISSLMNTAQGIQQYQQAQQLNPLAIEKAKADLTTSQVAAQKAQATLDPEIERIKAESTRAAINLNSDQLKNTREHLAASSRDLLSLLNKPEVTAKDIQDHVKTHLEIAGATPQQIKYAMLDLPTKGSTLENKAFIAKHATKSLAAEAALDKLLPPSTMISEGGQITPRQLGNQMLTGTVPGTATGPSIGMTPAPMALTQKFEPTGRVDVANNPTAYVRDAQGNLLGEVTIPAGVSPDQMYQPSGGQRSNVQPGGAQKGNMQPGNTQPAMNQPPANAPSRLAPYETPETVATERKRQLDTIAQRQTVAQSTYNYNQIINLADKSITGVGAQAIAKLGGGYAGIPWKADEASNLQQLGHYMALQTGNLAQQAGLGTDQGRSIAQEQIGTTNWTSDAIKATARTNRALTTGIDLYGLGMNNAIKKAGNNPLAGRDYTEKWSSVADIDALKYYDAIKNKDKVELRKVVDSVGGPESKGYADLITRYNKIYSLVTGGQ